VSLKGSQFMSCWPTINGYPAYLKCNGLPNGELAAAGVEATIRRHVPKPTYRCIELYI
jgi:hypothetical protein